MVTLCRKHSESDAGCSAKFAAASQTGDRHSEIASDGTFQAGCSPRERQSRSQNRAWSRMSVWGKNETCVNNAKECRHVASPELVLLRDLGQPSATRPLRASARLSSRSDISFCNLFTLRALNFALASTSLTAHQKPLTDAQSI